MKLRTRSGSWLFAIFVCVACQSDKSPSSSASNPNASEPDGAAAGSGAPTMPSATGPVSKGQTAGNGAPGQQEPGKPGTSPAQPPMGATEFTSADPNASNPGNSGGLNTRGVADAAGAAGSASTAAPTTAAQGSADGSVSMRAVERGDIYRVLDDHRILNLNAYRGLQVIDVSNVDAPRIEGRLAAVGTPLEMYVVGQRAIVLLNNWQGYYGARDDVKVESVSGALVLNVDISNRAQPKLLSQAIVQGSITTSRLTQGDGQAALYVAANVYQDMPPYTNTTLVKSFDVSGEGISEKSEIDLGGYVQDVQATTTDLLLVSSIDYNKQTQQSQVAVIDISRPDGTMVRGGSVTARGIVENKFNMDAYNGVLRVVSGATWSGTRENHLETFSLADLAAPKALSHCAFGSNEMLFATIFVENKAFFVTYLRQDPFHAFSIDDQGRCEEHTQYIVSGWNDFLRPTLNGTRLVGVGSNDTQMRRTVSVSLYDTTNIDNPNPLLARADLALDNSYSEAQWDDRAFSVIEGAVNVTAANGTAETGLILVPYEGYVQSEQRYVAQVQILTFSDRTLTRRGVMDHGSSVRRSFLADSTTAANLSEEELRLYNLADPGAPAAKGRVEVAPNYRQLFVYGDYVARIHDPSIYFGWSGNPNVTPPPAKVELVPRASDLETVAPVGSIDVPSNATLVQVNDLLLSVVTILDPATANSPDSNGQKWNTHIDAYDFADPTKPVKRGSLDTDRIRPNYGGFYPLGPIAARGGVAIDCFDCYPGRGGASTQYVIGDAVVFASSESAQKSLGIVHRCNDYPVGPGCAVSSDPAAKPTCSSYVSGGITCTTYKGQPEACTGSFYECPNDGGDCKEIDPDSVTTQRSCYDNEEFRYWNVYAFDALDVSNPDALVLGERVQMDKGDEGTSVYSNGEALYYNFQRPLGANNDPRAMVKRFFKRIDYADPQHGSAGPAINVPGDVIAADGNLVYTRDWVWEDQDPRTLVGRLLIDKDLAYLQASRVFSERSVSAVKLDGAGHMLVSSDPAYSTDYVQARPPTATAEQPQHTLSILDAQSLELSGETNIDTWATFQDATNGRALFSVSGGLLVVNVSDPTKPAAQAYFPALAWPNQIYFDGHEAMFAGGPYGVYRFDTDVFNLLMK